MSRKKDDEVMFCEQVARHVNRLRGTDYRAEPAPDQDDIGDVVLRSMANQHEPVTLQVVTIPVGDIGSRLDSWHRRRLEEGLPAMLEATGLRHVWVNLVLNEHGTKYGLDQKMVETLVSMIVEMIAGGTQELGGEDIYCYDPELSDRIGRVAATADPAVTGVRIGITLATYVPLDGRWISEGIAKCQRL